MYQYFLCSELYHECADQADKIFASLSDIYQSKDWDELLNFIKLDIDDTYKIIASAIIEVYHPDKVVRKKHGLSNWGHLLQIDFTLPSSLMPADFARFYRALMLSKYPNLVLTIRSNDGSKKFRELKGLNDLAVADQIRDFIKDNSYSFIKVFEDKKLIEAKKAMEIDLGELIMTPKLEQQEVKRRHKKELLEEIDNELRKVAFKKFRCVFELENDACYNLVFSSMTKLYEIAFKQTTLEDLKSCVALLNEEGLKAFYYDYHTGKERHRGIQFDSSISEFIDALDHVDIRHKDRYKETISNIHTIQKSGSPVHTISTPVNNTQISKDIIDLPTSLPGFEKDVYPLFKN